MSWMDRRILEMMCIVYTIRLKRYRRGARRSAKSGKAFNWYLCIGIRETLGILQTIESELNGNDD